jgi:toxin FitB
LNYLLDTCLLSELIKSSPNQQVLIWIKAQTSQHLFVSALTLAELHRGVAKLSSSKRKNALSLWLAQLEIQFEDRLLPFTQETSAIWGKMCAQMESKGHPMSLMDSMIAATAQEHGLNVVTRNEKDFIHAPVMVINPWKL